MTHDETSSWSVMRIVMVQRLTGKGVENGHDDMTMSSRKMPAYGNIRWRHAAVRSAVRHKVGRGMD